MASALASTIGRVHQGFVKLANSGQSPFLLLIRVYIGWQCVVSGHSHLTNFDSMVQRFIGWNIPMPKVSVFMSAMTEMVSGALILLGLWTRVAAILLTGNFVVAFLAVNLSDPKYHEQLNNLWSNQDVLLKDDAFPFLVTAIILLFFGPGWFSLDGLIRRWRTGRGAQRP